MLEYRDIRAEKLLTSELRFSPSFYPSPQINIDGKEKLVARKEKGMLSLGAIIFNNSWIKAKIYLFSRPSFSFTFEILSDFIPPKVGFECYNQHFDQPALVVTLKQLWHLP